MLVRKAGGSLEEFLPEKIIKTCMRSGLSREQAKTVLTHVTRKIRDKIPTNELLKIILQEIEKLSAESALRYNLRAAVAKLCEEGMIFEKYVQKILESFGFAVEFEQIIKGACVEHEIDLIAKTGGKTIAVECKHHRDFHTYTGLGETLEVWAKLEDINSSRKNRFDESWLVCNTKASEHAIRYCRCKGVRLVCWKFSSAGFGTLEQMIEQKKLYPLTIFDSVRDKKRFYDAGIITVKDLVEFVEKNSIDELSKRVGAQLKQAEFLFEESKKLVAD